MKKLLTILFILLFACINSYAGTRGDGVVISGGNEVEAAPAYQFYCEFEGTLATGTYTMSGNDYSAGDTTGTLTDTSGNAAIANPPTGGGECGASPGSGGKALYVEDGDKLVFDASGTDIFNSSEGRFELYVCLKVTTGDNFNFVGYGDSDDYLRYRIEADNDIKMWHTGQNNLKDVTDTDSHVADATWTLVRGRWSVTGDTIAVKIGTDNWQVSVDATTTTAFGTAPGAVGAGELGTETITDGYYIDDLKFFNTYDGSWLPDS